MDQVKTVLRVIRTAARESKLYFWSGIVSLLIYSSFPILTNLVIANIVEGVASISVSAGTDTVTAIQSIVGLIAIFIFLLWITEAAEEIFNSIASLLLRYDLSRYFSNVVFKKINEIDMEFFENPAYADLKSRALDTFEWRPADLVRMSFYGIQKLVSATSAGIAMFLFFPTHTILITLAIIPSMLVDYYFQAGAWDIWTSDTRTRRRYGYLLDVSNDSENRFTKELRLLGLGDYFRNMLDNIISSVYKKQKGIQYNRIFSRIIVNTIPVFVILFALNDIIQQIGLGTVSLATFTFILTNVIVYKNQLSFALFDISNTLSESKYVIDVFKFLDLEPKMKYNPNGEIFTSGPPKINFKNVDFYYPGTSETSKVLHKFNLEIKPGEKVAIVGENGAGKSTIIKLLLRFYDVSAGSLEINDKDIREYNILNWRKHVVALLQDFRTFKMVSLADNIGFGNLEHYLELEKQRKSKKPLIEIVQAAIDSRASSFIEKEPKGYENIVGRDFDGADFSGGEMQRLALARTFFRNAGLVIMDEPTSAVDAKAEMEIFASIKKHLEDKTVIFVSHRFSTVRVADRIIVVEDGSITEDGTHEELMANGATYSKMFSAQAEGYK